MPQSYPKGYFKVLRKEIKDAAFEELKKRKSVGEVRRLNILFESKYGAIKYLSKEYALLLKRTKGNIPDTDNTLSVINEAVNAVLSAKNPAEIKRVIRLTGEKIRLFKI